jgi:HSP20 family molecular chaperone IbpA
MFASKRRNKESYMQSYIFKDVFEMFDEVFGSDKLVALTENSMLYPAPAFPPLNVLMDKETKELTFEFALAGYKKEDADISFSGDFLTLKLKAKQRDLKNFQVLRGGIKTSDVDFKYACPSDKYDRETTSATFADGMLIIKVPSKTEVKPKKISIG